MRQKLEKLHDLPRKVRGVPVRPTGLDLSILVTPRIDFGHFRPGHVGLFYPTCRPDSARARIDFWRFRRFWAILGDFRPRASILSVFTQVRSAISTRPTDLTRPAPAWQGEWSGYQYRNIKSGRPD